MRFEFATATRLMFGPGRLGDVTSAVKEYGRRVMVVTGRSAERVKSLTCQLDEAGFDVVVFHLEGEPDTEAIARGLKIARESESEFVIGMGGGSSLDAAKAIAALLTNPGALLDYLEVVGGGAPLKNRSAPCVTIPTTSGTGAEVTKNAVIASKEHRVKVSLRSPSMLPCLAVVDPELTLGLPRSLTACTGMDALTQLIEPYVSCRANPVTDGFCLDGIRRVARSLRQVCSHPEDLAAREDMSLASLQGGLALANSGLGAVHGFAGPVGGMFPAPHGAVCAAMLAVAMEVNVRVIRERGGDSDYLERFDEVARLLTGEEKAVAADGVAWVEALTADLGIPGLGAYGIAEKDVSVLSEKGSAASSMKANPIELRGSEREEILIRSL